MTDMRRCRVHLSGHGFESPLAVPSEVVGPADDEEVKAAEDRATEAVEAETGRDREAWGREPDPACDIASCLSFHNQP